jgi:1,4-dihydroxy-2-naphthoate octaprenyltransferase
MSPQTRERMRPVAAFVRLSRLKFLVGGFAGFALGAAAAASAGAPIGPGLYAAGQTMVTAFHLMTHYANDYFDRRGDERGQPTAFSGGSGVLVNGALAPATALRAALVCAAIGAAADIVLGYAGSLTAAAVGAAIGIGAWTYSAPPVRLAARGWGELDAVLVVGILVPLAGSAAVSGRIGGSVLAATAAPACAMFALMIAVEWPDRAADSAAGKRNLVVRLRPQAAGGLAAVAALAVVPAMLGSLAAGLPWTQAPFALLLAPLAVRFAQRCLSPAAPAVEVAARGVTLFILTVGCELFGYIAIRR